MITPSFSLTATERVLPKLALDFTTATLDPRVTFTRTTDATHPATYVNSSGLIASATNNQPRFDYDPVALTCKGLLIEEQRSNLLTYSSDLSNAVWSTSNVTVSTDSATAPDGTSTADSLVVNSTNSYHRILRTLGDAISGSVGTHTAFLKANGYSKAYVRDAGGTGYNAVFNLSTGQIIANNGVTSSSIISMGNGWYRCAITVSGSAIQSLSVGVVSPSYTSGDVMVSWSGDNSSGIYVWGTQLEAGAFATSYIPTTSTSLTRNADVATMTGTNFSDWYNATEGTLFTQSLQSVLNAVRVSYYAGISDNTTNAQILTAVGSAANSIGQVLNSGTQASISSNTAVANTVQKVTLAYKANSFSSAGNGTLGTPDTSGTVPTVNRMNIGDRSDGARTLNGWVQKISYWPQRLTDNEVQAFSK